MTRAMSRVVLAAAVVCATAAVSLAQTDDDLVGNQDVRNASRWTAITLVVKLPEGTRELTVADDFRFTVNGQQLSVHELKAGHEGHRHHHDADDGHAGHRHRGEERHRHAGDRFVASSCAPPRDSRSFSQGDIDKRGVKIVKDGKPATVIRLPCRAMC